MTPLELAEEIINGRRIKRQDDLTFFLDAIWMNFVKGQTG